MPRPNAARARQLDLNTGARDAGAAPDSAPGEQRETPILRQIRVALNATPGVRVWRNNVGVDLARGIRYGLGVGSADLVGLLDGRFFAVEVKTLTGRVSDDQTRWLDVVRRLGGIAVVCRSADDARAAVALAREPGR